MKNLKKFAATADYNAFKNSTGMTYPLTSYIENTRETKFDHWIPNNVVMYLDDCDTDEVPTPDDMQEYAEWCEIGREKGQWSNDRYYFIDEVIFDNVYYWLWYAAVQDSLNYYSYILTPTFKNFKDLYRHSALYNGAYKYCPIAAKLTADIDFDEYNKETLGFNSFDYSGKVLINIREEDYQKHPLPFVSPYNENMVSPVPPSPLPKYTSAVMVVDRFGSQYLSEMDEEFFNTIYSHGNHVFYEFEGQGRFGYASYYDYVDVMEYKGNYYYLWQESDEYGDYCNLDYNYCLTKLNPEELLIRSKAYDFGNDYTDFIFLNTDMEEYHDGAPDYNYVEKHLVDVYDIVK